MSATQVSQHFLQFRIQYSSIALLYFDYALTFPDEVKHMWLKRVRLSTFLYICCRYALIANVLYLLAQAHVLHSRYRPSSGSSCDAWYKFDGAISVLGRAAVLATLTLRTYAIYNGNKLILALFMPLGIMCVVLDIMHVPGLACAHSHYSQAVGNTLAIGMAVFECLAALLAAIKGIITIRSGDKWHLNAEAIENVLFRQGLIYFLLASFFSFAAVVLNFRAPIGSFFQRLPNALNLPVSSLLTARFLLQIREAQGKRTIVSGSVPNYDTTMAHTMSAFRAVSRVDDSLREEFSDGPAVNGQRGSDEYSGSGDLDKELANDVNETMSSDNSSEENIEGKGKGKDREVKFTEVNV